MKPENFVFSFLKPVYTFINKKRTLVGTCALFKISGEHCLITAAHVFTKKTEFPLYLQNVLLESGYWSPINNNIDFSFYKMSDKEVSSLSDCTFIDEKHIDRAPLKKGQACGLLGYPVSKNKKNLNSNKYVCPEIHIVSTSVAIPRSPNDEHHFWIHYNKEMFSPEGMSGGLIIRATYNPIPLAYIVGMPIEYDRKTHHIKCINYYLIANSIRSFFAK